MHKKNYAQNIIRSWLNNDELLYKQTVARAAEIDSPTAFGELITAAIDDFMLFECNMEDGASFEGLTCDLIDYALGEADVFSLAEEIWLEHATTEQKRQYFTTKWEN